jgi:hypothetical protein
MGAPFYQIWGQSHQLFSMLLASSAVAFLVTSLLYFGWHAIKSPRAASLQLALIFFLLYIGGTALATAEGRFSLGVAQALASRYSTPVLMAWAVLAVLYAPLIEKCIDGKFHRALPLLLIPFFLLPQQIQAFVPQTETIYSKKLAALTLALGIDDLKQFSYIGPMHPPFHRFVLNLSKEAAEKKLSIFNHPHIKGVSTRIGTTAEQPVENQCVGYLDSIQTIDTDFRYKQIKGWIFEPNTQTVPEIIHLVNSNNIIIGYALTGQPRSDVQSGINRKAKLSGFTGYILSDEIGQPIQLQGLYPNCKLTVSS